MRKYVIAVSAVALLVGGCSSESGSEPDAKELSPEASAEPTGGDQTSAEPADSPQSHTSLTGTASVGEDISVRLSGVKRAVSSEWASPGDTPFAEFTIQITNKGAAALDPAMLLVSCAYGDEGRPSEAVFDSDGGVGGAPSVQVLPGKSATWTEGCTLPKDESRIQIQVEHVGESQTALFLGEVT